MMEAGKIKDIMSILGHEFKDASLLEAALTHSSLTKGKQKHRAPTDYERLEFLGDRVLGLVISEELFKRFDAEEAGQLSRRYNAQVRREALAEIALEIGLDGYIRMADDLAAHGGLKNPAILEDVTEAIIAALYLDGGFAVAKHFIKANWWKRFDHEGASQKDAKSALQEWLAKKGNLRPIYTVVEETGPDHDPHFSVEVTAEGRSVYVGRGSSKQAAEKEAAEKMLKDLQSD